MSLLLPGSVEGRALPEPYYSEDGVTIYHGDCREVLPTLDISAAVTVTSPPYWNARAYGGVHFATYADYLEMCRDVLGVLLPRTEWLVWVAGYVWDDGRMYDCSGDAARIAEDAGFTRRIQVPWVKYDYAPQPSIDLAPAHELIQVLARSAAPPCDFDAIKVTRRVAERAGRLAAERSHDGGQRGGTWAGVRDGTKQAPNVVITQKLNGAERLGHPAAFPAEVVQPWVLACSTPGQTVLDPFAGSGTTLRVAHDNGREAIGIEVNERYCEIAAKRLAQGVLPL